eukprot:g41156.t1
MDNSHGIVIIMRINIFGVEWRIDRVFEVVAAAEEVSLDSQQRLRPVQIRAGEFDLSTRPDGGISSSSSCISKVSLKLTHGDGRVNVGPVQYPAGRIPQEVSEINVAEALDNWPRQAPDVFQRVLLTALTAIANKRWCPSG